MKRVICALCLSDPATAAFAEKPALPPPDFYQGQYRMIGLAPDGLVDRELWLDSAGDGLVVSICGMANAGRLRLPKGGEEDPYVTGRIGAGDVICEAFWTFENYPLLACYGADGSRLTLWPGDDFGAELTCAD